MVTATLHIRHFTDPGCPFAFSAEPARLKLRWLFGDQLEWEDRMVVLARSRDHYAAKGFTPEKQSASFRRLQREHGMPIDPVEREAIGATEPACRAVVAARLHAPDRSEQLLRRLRVRYMASGMLDDPELIATAARDAGLDPEELRGWMEGDDVAAALEEDVGLARQPAERALALDGKLADAGDGRRYTCPSYELGRTDGRGPTLAVPGFQPFAAYEVVLANLAPELKRRPAAEEPGEVLEWAGTPLASVEVAAILESGRDEARERLSRVAAEEPVGAEGWWQAR